MASLGDLLSGDDSKKLQVLKDQLPEGVAPATDDTITLGSDAYRTLPGPEGMLGQAESQLPALAEKAAPAGAEAGMGEAALSGLGSLLSKGMPITAAIATLLNSTPTSTLADDMPGMRGGKTPPPSDKDVSKKPIPTQAARSVAADDEDEDETPTEARQPKPTGQSMKDMLSGLFGSDLGDDALKEAQQHRNQLEQVALAGRAGKEINAGLSRGAYNPNYDVQNAQMQSAGQGIQDILQRRQGKIQEMQGGLSLSDLQDKQQMRDSTSPVSEAYRTMALQLNPKLQADPNFTQMTAEGIKNTMPMVDMSIRMQAINLRKSMMQNYKQIQDQMKAGSDMPKAMTQALNRGAGMQADQSNLAAKKILDAFKLYPNLDNMPSTILENLRPELAKLFSGGIGSEGASAKLLDPTFANKLSTFMGRFTGNPPPGEMGAFLQENLPYIQKVQKTSQEYVRDKLKPFVAGYKPRVDKDTFNNVMGGYGEYFPEYADKGAAPQVPTEQLKPNEVKRTTKDGKTAIFDSNTKQFLRYE